MTLLRAEDLERLIDEPSMEERLVIMPLLDRDKQLGPSSIDLRLGTEFLEIRRRAGVIFDPPGEGRHGSASEAMEWRRVPDQEEHQERVVVPLGEAFALHPGQFVLGATLEFIRMPRNLGGQVLSRSSWGRWGLLVATAVVVHPGFGGCLTLELVNTGSVPIYLYPGLRIAQLQVWRLEQETRFEMDAAKYKGPLGPQGARLAWEEDERQRIIQIGRILHGAPEDGAANTLP